MSPRNRGDSTQTITIAYPPIALPAVTVCAPAPRLLSPDINPEHVGLDRAGLVEHLAWMGRSPRWRPSVIELSRKRRFAAPDDVIASLKERATAPPAVAAASAEDAGVAALCAELDLEDVPRAPCRRRAR